MHESPHGDWVRYGDLALATQRAEAAEAECEANERHEYALRLYKETKAECEALRYSNAMLSRIVQDQLADLGLKGIGDHMSQYLLPDDECDKCEALRKDAARLDYLADQPVFEGFADSQLDVFELESIVAEQNGRSEPTQADRREAFRRMIDAALAVQPTTGEAP
jgi:hypothetical protein